MLELSYSQTKYEINIKIVNNDKESFYEDVAKIKSIQGRRWVPEGKIWTIPAQSKDLLTGLFHENEILWEEQQQPVSKSSLPNFSIDTVYLDEMKLVPYEFQIIGANFLSKVQRCLLGDEMGLGKTIQAIAASYVLNRKGEASKALILCPASLKYQWGNEIEKFTDLTYTIIDGNKAERTKQYQADTFFIIANYELLLRDLDDMSMIFPDIIIEDECHRTSNHAAKTTQNLLKLDAPYKWGLTGTPLQNKPEEIFNIFSFLQPDILGNFWVFRKRYIKIGDAYGRKNVPLGPQNLSELHGRVSPYMLRRLKKDVAKDLPDIIHTTRIIEMSKDQKQLHEIVYNDFQEHMKAVESLVERDEFGDVTKKPAEADKALGYFILMQEIADSLELLSMSDSKLAASYSVSSKSSPKLDELFEICKERVTSNPKSKTVIFTQFERMQRLVEDKIKKLGKSVKLNGKMKAQAKQDSIDSFTNDPDINFFLATDSGNFGINLANADCLINVESPWNPSVADQRAARIHRLTSTFDKVEIITLVCKDSIDEIIQKVIYKKKAVSKQVVEYTEEEKEELDNLTINKLRQMLGRY